MEFSEEGHAVMIRAPITLKRDVLACSCTISETCPFDEDMS